MAGAPGRVAARDDHALHPRHQARRGRPRPDHRAGRGARRCGTPRSTSCSTLAPLPDPGFGNLLWQAASAPGRSSPRAAARVRREGDARGRRPDHVDRARTRRTRTPCTPPSTRRSTTPRCARSSTSCSHLVAAPGWSQRARGQAARADHARRPRRLPGQRAVGAEPGRPRQPAAGRLRRRADRLRAGGSLPLTRLDDPARPSCCSPARAPRCAATAPSCSRRTRRSAPTARPPTTCSPSTAAARSPSSTRLPVGLADRGGWGDTILDAAGRTWVDVLADARSADTTRSRRCRATYPVALLEAAVTA